MKKLNKLFAILIAVLGVGSLSAQTDVTSTYLTNAGFETDGHQTGIKVPTGWTLGTTSGGYTSYRPISDTSTPNGSLPISNGITAGASEGSCYLYMRTNWGASVCELTQTTQVLPAGKYKLMVDVALPQTQTSRLRTLTIKVTGSTSGTTNSVECCYNPSIWSTVCIPFEVSTEETVVISLYHNDTSGGCGDGVLTAVDNVRLLSYDYAALTSALTEAETLYDSSKEGATELNTAMNTAKSLTESSDKSTIASAAEALLNALDTYKQVQFVVPSSTDYTSWIANAQLETTTGGTVFSSKANMWNSNVPSNWYVTRAVNGNMNATTFGSGQSGKAFEIWATDANTVIGTFFQPISGLPAGKYTLKGYLQNSGKLFVTNGTENTEYSSSPSSTGSWQQFSVTFVKKSASDNLIIGAQTTAAQHFIVDGFSLECIGLDLLKLTSQRDGLVSDLEALQSTLPTTYYSNTVATAIETANAADTESTLTAAINNLSSILTTANSISDAYKQLKRLIDLCSEYTDPQHSNANSDEVLSTFNEAINTATTNGNAATTVDAINTVYNTLESARQAYAKNAVPVYPYPFDMTFLLPNTTFDSNIDGWTKTGGANWMSAGKNVECYNTTFEFSMEYTGLNSGSWEIQVDAFYRYGGYNNAETAHNGGTEQLHAILYANNNTVAVKSIMEGANKAGSVGAITTNGVRVPDAPAHCDAYFATGCYANAIATVIADGKLKVGIKKETTQGADWTIFDNFKLIYKGIDVTDLQNALSALITTSDAIKDKKMGTAESAALSTALDNADATVTNADDLSEMISNLQSAYDNAAASISTYAAVSAYIAKANKINESIAASYQTQYDNGTIEGDAETVRQALNVATFNYVDKVFGNEIVLTDWGAASNAMWSASGEHWDGTTGEGCTSYYDANGTNTTHTLSKTVELTPGTYIFRGAGRSNTNTTLTLSIDIDGIEPVVFNPKGNTGRGIDKEGNATFADDAEYARNGQGQGWEWEFIKFTLKETTTVTLTATCKTSGSGWASFGNNGLWMDGATYVEANAGAITAPKNEAEALVDTKPMGAAENAALANAIAQAKETLNTPEKLNAAIEALETAVANAKAWLTAYNEAKAPLVAALERFETDFNDGANGALRFIVGWNDLLEAVAEAAVAKDAFNNYEGFTEAAAALNTAMDAVYGDYLKYGMLEDCTDLIGGADCTANDPSWSGSGRTTATAQHWSGIEKIYFAQNHENGAARTQIVNLPKDGTYLLKVAARAVESASYVDIIINGKSHKTMGAHGRTGGTIATDGTEWVSVAAGIEAGKTFANDNKGFGWVYQYIYFDAKAGENTIAISLSNTNNNREANVGGMMLYYLRPNYTIEEDNIVKHYGEYTEDITAVHTTHDVTNATMSNLAVNVTATPNTLIIANEGQVSNANNVVVDGTAASLVLNDGGYAFNTTADFTATALNYAREFTKDTWLTVCLPFAYPIPENVKVETLGAIDLDTKTFTFDEVTGTMEANTPYLIKNSTETAALFASFSNVEVEATPAAMNVTITADNSEHQSEFIGTYTTVKTDALMEDGTYDILFFGTDGQLYYLSQGITTKVVNIKPFRAYIRLPKDAINWSDGQQVRVRHRNSAMTDIDTLESADDSQKTTVIYDMHGRRVTEMAKGSIYIVNGKKVIVK